MLAFLRRPRPTKIRLRRRSRLPRQPFSYPGLHPSSFQEDVARICPVHRLGLRMRSSLRRPCTTCPYHSTM